VLPHLFPLIQKRYPKLLLEVRETQTSPLLTELVRGDLDCVMLALPVDGTDVETLKLFDDAFLLAVPADDRLRERGRVNVDHIDLRRLILLEEGHCLRDQALAICAMNGRDQPAGLGATSLTTVMQMVANGLGVTLLPEVAAKAEARNERVKLLRLAGPAPTRTIGLAWRPTSPRKKDFAALGEIVKQTLGGASHKRGRRAK
jgi:LysR family hydrogen peroxide-inducible transcriptional activator